MSFKDLVAYYDKNELRVLLQQKPDGGIKVRYQKPYVDRIYYRDTEGFIFFHKISSCEKRFAYVHPHPWPSHVKILKGSYTTGFFHFPVFGKLEEFQYIEPIVTCKLLSGSEYEMLSKTDSHFVWPHETVYSVMIVGPRFANQVVNPDKPDLQIQMTNEEMINLSNEFEELL